MYDVEAFFYGRLICVVLRCVIEINFDYGVILYIIKKSLFLND